jgi:hypothetical protein
MDNRMFPETSRWNPAGNQSRPVESGQQPEASLAWSVARPGTKRRQRRCRAMVLSPEISLAGAHAVSRCGGRADVLHWPETIGPAGVGEHGGHRKGFPRNRRGLSVSESRIGSAVVPNPKPPGPWLRAADRRERTDAAQLPVPPRESNERGGTDWQESECLHSTATCATGPRGRARNRRRAN